MNNLISQQLNAGNNFDGSAPSGDVEQDGDRAKYHNLTAGGLFDFEFKQSVKGLRILLELGDASDWSLELRTTDGDGNTYDSVLYERADFTSNSVIIHEPNLFHLDRGETLRLTTSGASSSMFASISVSR